MSYDELPPDAQPPHSMEEAASSEQDPSAQDAPPAKRVRRRAKTTGTDAASENIPTESTETPAVKPGRTTRRRVSVSATPEAGVDPVAPPASETALPAADEPVAKPVRRRVTAKAAREEASAPKETMPEPVEEPASEPTARRSTRRTRRVATPEAAAETPEAAETSSPEASSPPPAESPPARRGRRSRKAEEPQPEAPVEPEPIETVQAGTGPLSAEETEADTAERRGRRSRRGGRNRRNAPRNGQAQEVVEVVEESPELIASVEEPPIDLSVGAHLISVGRHPVIHVNGTAYPPVLFFGNMDGDENTHHVISEVHRAAQSGVHLHSTLIELPCPLSGSSQAIDVVDRRLRALLDADPEGYVMPRIVFLPARGWKREYPTEISVYADGSTGDPSMTSVRFWQECERSLASLIAHINDQIWGPRVFGYHLERGEWFQPADPGFDRSTANRDAFRDWLRDRYNQDLVALRAAWYDSDVQFHTAEIPTLPAKPTPQRAFYETRRERNLIDFNEFTSESTARRLIALAQVVKQATASSALTSVCYGYTLEFGHGFSGHLALDLLLADRSIDLICGPPSYRDRKAGGAASYPAPISSPPLHGKLWLSEDDTKTYLASAQQDPADFNPRMGDRFQTEQAQARAVGKSLAHDVALGWMDLWGEGWLDEDALWDRIAAFQGFAAKAGPHRGPDVVALIDEKSLLHLQKGELFFRRLTNGLRDTLQRAGVNYGFYLQSDLLSPEFPLDAKLYLFLTPYRLPSAQRNAIKEKLQRDGKTLAWLYAPGACEERPGIGSMMDETATGAIGISLRQQPWNSEIGSRIVDTTHAVTAKMHGRDIGSRERLNPSFYVNDPDATILAEYQGFGLPSLAVKNMGTWRSVFVGDPVLPLELLRGICRYAGVHLWVDGGEDVFEAGEGWIMIHASRDGQRMLRLPAASALYDITERRLVADETREYRYFLRTGATRLFFAGSIERMRELALPDIDSEGREQFVLSADLLPVETETPRPANPLPPLISLPSSTANPDLETLRAVLAMQLPEDEAEMEVTAEVVDITLARSGPPSLAVLEETLGLGAPSGNGRRRRRRGGRGRGRRRPGEGESAEGAVSEPTGAPAPNDEEPPL